MSSRSTVALVLALCWSSSAAAATPCPPEMAQVGESCVDRWEASLVELDERGRELGPFSPYVSPERRYVKAVSKAGVTPQAYLSWHDAKAACENAGKRLCRADEWVSACKGPEKSRYPYGNVHVAKACIDTGRTAPLSKYWPAAQMFSMQAMNDPRLNQTPNTVAETGEATQCTNAYGVFDMVGNVHEWAADGTFRGGYFLDTHINREGCDYVTTAHEKSWHDYSIGFRCCADPGSLQVDPAFYAQLAEIAVGAKFTVVAAR